MRHLYGDGNVVNPVCFNANILIVISCSRLDRLLLGKLSEAYMESPCVIYGLHVNQELSQKGSFNLKNMMV